MGKHAKRILQPSGFKRTMNCPGWGQLCEKLNIKPKPSSKYAAEGSVAHHLGEKCLQTGVDAAKYLDYNGGYKNGKTSIVLPGITLKGQDFVFKVDEDMAEAVQVYLDVVRHKRETVVGGKFSVEERLDLDWLVPGMYGTGDHVIVEPLRCLYVDDYKHGQGVAVEVGDKVGDNPQLSIYALGALGKGNPHMVEEVVVTIVQPRAIHPHGSVRYASFNVTELLEWGDSVLVPAAKAAQTPGAPILAGDWCRWCDAEDQCPALRKRALKAADTMFDDALVPVVTEMHPVEPALLNGEQMGRVLEFAGMFESWIKVVKEEAYQRLEKGDPEAPDTVKLVAGRLSNRAWVDDEEKVRQVIDNHRVPEDEMYAPKKLKSPAQMEKALKAVGHVAKEAKDIVAEAIKERKPGKPIMVPIDDNRKALPPAVDRMFKE